MRTVLISLLATTALFVTPTRAADLKLRPGDRVVLLGGTFVERMQSYGFTEAALIAGYADRNITVRNLGWSGDNVFGEARALFGTVEDGFERIEKDVREADPPVGNLNYGGNEAPAGSAGLDEFQKGLERLLRTLANIKARVIVLLPHSYEDLGGTLPSPESYNQDLDLYRRALHDAAQRHKLPVADLAIAVQTARADLDDGDSITDNGVHPSPLGYRAIASHLATALGARQHTWHVDIDATHHALDAVGCLVTSISTSANNAAADQLQFEVIDDVLELSQQNGYGSPTTVGQGTLTIRGLAAGDYTLTIDEKAVHTADAATWDQGVTLTQRGGQEQAERLRQAVVAKNQLYFYRYRPQNETYLFLFRKHEQGNNAAEIPEFDPLIEKLDRRIFQLRRPHPRKFELLRQ